jgi:hypothetical protein
VDFALFRSLAPDYIPQVTLDRSIVRLREGLVAMGFADKDFRNSPYMRSRRLSVTSAPVVSAQICAGCHPPAPEHKAVKHKTALEGS